MSPHFFLLSYVNALTPPLDDSPASAPDCLLIQSVNPYV